VVVKSGGRWDRASGDHRLYANADTGAEMNLASKTTTSVENKFLKLRRETTLNRAEITHSFL
jgi:hypothetical protein